MKLFNILLNKINELDDKIKKIMNVGLHLSFLLCIIATISLFTYEFFYSYPNLFYAGISLLHTSLMFACSFFIFGIGFDTIKKQLV